MHQTPLAVCCLLVGAGLGWLGGSQHPRNEAPASDDPASVAAKPSARTAASASRATTEGGFRDDWQTKLDSILSRYDPREMENWIQEKALTKEMILAALAHVSGKPAGSRHRADLIADLYRAWARLDSQEAWKAALVDPDATNSSKYLGAVAGELAKTQPEAALALALSLQMGAGRAAVLQEVFGAWGGRNLEAAVAYWNSHPELPANEDVIRAAVSRAAEKNPRFAAGQALLLRGANIRGPILASVLIDWAKRDIGAAIEWAEDIVDPAERATELAILVDVWAGSDPEAAFAYAQEIEASKGKTPAIRNAWTNWLQKDPEAALDYFTSHPSEALTGVVRDSFVNATDALSLREQQTLLAKITDESLRAYLSTRVAKKEVSDGQYLSALELLDSLPDSRDRDNALSELGLGWGRDDPEAAAAWLNDLPDSSDRDLAIEGFARNLARTDPQAALEWIDTVGDEGVRMGGLKNIALRWMETDTGPAEAWLAKQTWLSDVEKAQLRQNARGAGFSYMTYGVNVTDRR